MRTVYYMFTVYTDLEEESHVIGHLLVAVRMVTSKIRCVGNVLYMMYQCSVDHFAPSGDCCFSQVFFYKHCIRCAQSSNYVLCVKT